MTTSVAVIADLENLLYASRRETGSAVRAHLRWVWNLLEQRYNIRWATAAGDYWLTETVLTASVECRLRVRPVPLGKNVADRHLLQYGMAVPASIHTAVIVTGDSDLVPLVRHLQARDVRVVVAAAPGSTSRRLVAAADEFLPLASWPMIHDYGLAA